MLLILLIRNVVIIRRLLKNKDIGIKQKSSKTGQASFDFVENCSKIDLYEYAVLAISMDDEILTIAQHYRDRADSENAFDELKNQWGWSVVINFSFKQMPQVKNAQHVNQSSDVF